MSNSRINLTGLAALLGLASAARGNGGGSGKAAESMSDLFDIRFSVESFDGVKDMPEEVRAAVIADAKAGDIVPTPDCECEFCILIREHAPTASACTWKVIRPDGGVYYTDDGGAELARDRPGYVVNRAPESAPGEPAAVCDAPEAPPGGAKPFARETVPMILREAAETYEARNPLYGDAYKHYGATMMGFFPLGITLAEPEDWNRFGLFSMMVSKMHRIAANLSTGGHRDSALDLSTYAAMMVEMTEQK